MTIEGITPYLHYEDADAAIEWLTRVFGFGPSAAVHDDDGRIREAEIAAGPAKVMLSGRAPEPGRGAGSFLIVHVGDVDARYELVRAAGVECDPPVDRPFGPRTFLVTDPWGYRWQFWQGEAVYAD
jgi:uncharacterized glyoxalase superfamily protein PhnB